MTENTVRPTHHTRQTSFNTVVILVSAATIISLSQGMRQSLGLFQGPIHTDLSVSATAFGFALALQNIVWGLSQPFLGMLGDRYGAMPVLIGSAIIYAGGLVLMAFGGSALGLNGGAGIMVGLGIAGTSYGVLIGAVSQAVRPERRTRAVGLVAAAGSLATFVLAPIGQYLIESHGWQIALVVFAAIAMLMGVLAVAIRQESVASRSDAIDSREPLSIRDALLNAANHRGFVLMTVAFFACGFQLMFITTHLPQFLAICGVSSGITAGAIGIIGLSNAIGSYMFGVLGSRYSPKRLLSLIYLLRTLAIVIFVSAPITPVSTLAFAAAMGFLWLGVVPLVSSLLRQIFGLRYFNTLFGVVFLSHQIGAFIGAWLGGLSFDFTGSYTTAWAAMVVVGLSAAIIQWLMDDRISPNDRLRLATAASAA